MNILLRILPPIWFFLFLSLGVTLHFSAPGLRVISMQYPAVWIFGGVLFVASFIVSLYASALFSKEKTEILPTSETNSKLVVYGPFKYSRNPMYLGMVGQLFGIALMFMGSLPLIFAALGQFLILNFVFIPFEEKKLARIFGEQYEAYRRKVRRWL